ncbi:unnamed protein product [Effrenium voratum]|uniref:Uncharacterized protein n=1 Tax=Effrenium voratum TaxID=2562239 RepID=A0AA36NJD3_9DINO|nr:unnamed protein product [Effrenium voratum]
MEKHGAVWVMLRFALLFCSVVGSCWLLRAAWKPCYLFTRQLRHLAIADLGLALAAPGCELGLMIWAQCGLPDLSLFSRCLFRSFLCAGTLVETQIAAGVMCSALRWQSFRALARLLPFTWFFAALVGAGDACSMRGSGHFSDDGFAKVIALVMCVNFLLALLMYVTSIVAVLWTPAPSAVVRRASWRALAFPCGFMVTGFPQMLLYIGVFPQHGWFRHFATLAVYSNGWINAAVYSWQNRHLCGAGIARRAEQNSCSLAPSFHVGFGRESRLFPQAVSSEPSELGAELGVVFELRESTPGVHDHLRVDAVRTAGGVLLEGADLLLRREGGLCFTVPLWIDASAIESALDAESSQGLASETLATQRLLVTHCFA